MSKKIIALVTASLLVIGLGIFTISNAFALNYYEWSAFGLSSQAKPLSIQLTNAEYCKNLKIAYKQDVANIKAKGLSIHLSATEVKGLIDDAKYGRDLMCLQAQDPATLASVCKDLKKNYGKEVQRIKAKGLSIQLSQENIQSMIKGSRDYKKSICDQARIAKKKPTSVSPGM